MKIDVDRLNAKELKDVADQADARLRAVTTAQERLSVAEAELDQTLRDRDNASADIRTLRVEIAELRRIISGRRRKAAAVADTPPSTAPRTGEPATADEPRPKRRRRKSIVPFDQPKNTKSA